MTYKKGEHPWNWHKKASPKERARLKAMGFKPGTNSQDTKVVKQTETPAPKQKGFWTSFWDALFGSI